MADVTQKAPLRKPTEEERETMRNAQLAAVDELRQMSIDGIVGLVVTRDSSGSPYVRLKMLQDALIGQNDKLPSLLGGLPVRVQSMQALRLE